MLKNVEWLGHATIKFNNGKIIYVDPYRIKKDYNDADIIFITHDHYDHFSEEDLKKCIKKDTKFVITEDLYSKTINLGIDNNNILKVLPNNNYIIDNISFSTVSSYNTNKDFHPKENNWVGYIINIDNTKYYIAGDTDITEENKLVKCDVAFLPIGGVYTMDSVEAAELANIIKPKIVVPIHYGTIVGNDMDALNFKNNIDSSIKCIIMDKK